MQMMKVNDLIPHPRNTEFFDDMTGEKWNEFLESVKTSGVIEPIVITQDKIIVSGHQRVRACKELGIDEVLADTKHYDNDDAVLKDLIETNVRQRGSIGGSDIKLGNRIRELERIYGIKHGNNQHNEDTTNGRIQITQQEIAEKLGIDVRTLQRAKALASLPLEILELVDKGTISPSTASRLIARLTPEEQEKLVVALPVVDRLTQKQVQKYIDQIKTKDNQINGYKMKAEKDEQEKASLREELEQERQKEPETIIKEVVPDDYELYKKDNERLNREYQKRCTENIELKNELHALREDSARENLRERLENDCIFFCARCDDFLKGVGGYAYLADKLNELPDMERRSYKKAIEAMNAWSENILATMNEVKMMN